MGGGGGGVLPFTDNIKGAIMTLFPGGKQKILQKGVKERKTSVAPPPHRDRRARSSANDALIIGVVMYCLWKYQPRIPRFILRFDSKNLSTDVLHVRL